MTNVLAQFATMLGQSAASGGSTELLVEQLGEEGELVRRCAITHQFSPEVLRVLDPALNEAEAAEHFDRLARLSLVTPSPDGLALHDRAREQLFAGWFAPDRIEALREISARLTQHFGDILASGIAGADREKITRRYLFHLVAVDQDSGIAAFEDEIEMFRSGIRYTARENLLRMIHEYDPILTPPNHARVGYCEAELALDRGDADHALELFAAVAAEPSLAASCHARALNGIGLAHAARCRWKKAALAFLDALRFADEHQETRGFRSNFLQDLATVYRDTGNIEPAEMLLTRGLALLDGCDDNDHGIAASIHNTFGTVYLRAGEPQKAVASLLKSLECLNEDNFARARVYNNLGLATMRIPDLPASEEWFNKSLKAKALAGDTVGQANTYINLVRLYREQRALTKATGAAASAAELYARVFFWKEAGNVDAMLARFHLEAKNPAEAARSIMVAFDAYERAHASDERDLLEREILNPGGDEQRVRLDEKYIANAPSAESQIDTATRRLLRQREAKYASGKWPVLAALLSLFVIGLGQLYNADWRKGFFMIAAAIGGIFCISLYLPFAFLTVIFWFGMAVWSVKDAWVVASGKSRRW